MRYSVERVINDFVEKDERLALGEGCAEEHHRIRLAEEDPDALAQAETVRYRHQNWDYSVQTEWYKQNIAQG
jgi:hypothetical protein